MNASYANNLNGNSMRLLRFPALAFCLIGPTLFLPTIGWAQDDQIKLTGSMVENFINAHGELATLAASLSKKYGDRSDTADDDPVASLPAYQDIPQAKSQTAEILERYRFKSLDELDIINNSVMLAYQADVPDAGGNQPSSASAGSQDDIDADKAKAKAEVEADASLTPDKKQEALQQIEDQYASLQALVPLPGNPETVRPYLDRLKPIAETN
jgi:hypothetical protein